MKNTRVLLITEGTYPYVHGGVSTWSHHLTQRVKKVDYYLYSINADEEFIPKYDLGDSVKGIVQVPMWSPEEPSDCVDYNQEYSKIIKSRSLTTDKVVSDKFIKTFKQFLKGTFSENVSVEIVYKSFFDMWVFFQKYDYKTTMTSEPVWNTFCETIIENWTGEDFLKVTIEDFTMALRLLYRFLITIAIKPPKSDITHLTLSGIGIIPALCLKFKYNTPILLTEHGVYIRERLLAIGNTAYSPFVKSFLIRFSEMVASMTYEYSDQIVTVSKFNIKWEKLYGADEKKISIIYNGVDPDLFKPLEKPEHLKNIPTVVAAARIFELKDILTMIRTCDVVRKSIPNVKFLIYGNKDAVPEYTEECDKLIEELAVGDNFKLAGFHNAPTKLYSEGDISILTSISEGFPYTVIESMSCGVPVVSTDVGGVTEALDESCGFVCKPKDYNDLAEKVIRLLKDKELRNQMAINGRKKVIEKFTIQYFIQCFEMKYTQIMKSEESKVFVQVTSN